MVLSPQMVVWNGTMRLREKWLYYRVVDTLFRLEVFDGSNSAITESLPSMEVSGHQFFMG